MSADRRALKRKRTESATFSFAEMTGEPHKDQSKAPQESEQFAKLRGLMEPLPLTDLRCSSACETLSEIYVSCMEEESFSCDTLQDQRRMGLLLQILDSNTYADLCSGEVPRRRNDCIAIACQIFGHFASLPPFRHGEHAKMQTSLLTRLVALVDYNPNDHEHRFAEDVESAYKHICETITVVCRDHKDAKKVLLEVGGVAPVVGLLQSCNAKVQRAASGVLRTLAFKEDQAKHAIIDSGAVEPLIRMLRSEDHQTHYEAVGTLGNLVHSSPDIKRSVLQQGVLQPVVNLLQCSCRDSLREAALLIGQFAQCESRNRQRPPRAEVPTDDYRVKIVQRGAVPPLVHMLKTQDRSLREMAAFALGRLAQNQDNQAGILAMGAVPPLLELLDSGARNLEHNAAFTLYGLADSVDNVAELVKCGAFERLRVAEFPDDQPTKDCIVKTIKRITEKIQATEFVKDHLMQLLRSRTVLMQQRTATALAHILNNDDFCRAYSLYGGGAVLLDMLVTPPHESPAWRSALEALSVVVKLCREHENMHPSSFTQAPDEEKVYIGKGYVNNPRVHDVVFVVEGEPFYAHKLALSAASEAFRAMFDSGCVEGASGVPNIVIPNLTRDVFQAMMMFVYTGELGQVAETEDILTELLQAADQYLLEPLKAHCATLIASQLTPGNVMTQYELARQFNSKQLAHSTMAYIILESEKIQEHLSSKRMDYVQLIQKIHPELLCYIETALRVRPADMPQIKSEA